MRYIYLITALIFALMTSCWLKTSDDAPTSSVRIGINTWTGYEFLYAAQELGFFREIKVNAKVVEFNSLSDARRSLEKGDIDVMGTTLVELLFARANSQQQPKIFFVADYSSGADAILVEPRIKSIRDLKGKRIGVEVGSVGIYLLARALEKNQMKLSDVKVVGMDQLKMLNEVKNQRIDAAVTYAPFVKRFREAGFESIFTSAEIPGEIVDVLVANQKVFESRADDLAKIAQAFERARIAASSVESKAIQVMARRQQITPEAFLRSMSDGIEMVPMDQQRSRFFETKTLDDQAKKTESLLREMGVLKDPVDLSGIKVWVM